MRGVIGLLVFAATIVPALAAVNSAASPQLGVETTGLAVAMIAGLALFLFRRRAI